MKLKTLIALVGCLSFVLSQSAISQTATRGTSRDNTTVPKYSVVWPRGTASAEPVYQGPRLETLEGKTICLLAIGAFRTDESMPVLEAALKAQYPSATVVPYTEFPLYQPTMLYYPDNYRNAVSKAILSRGCDAVIAGNGG
jgi:hypothetical protein